MGVERLRTVEYTLMMGPSVERPVLVFLRGQDLAFLAWYKLLNNISPNFPKNQPLVFCMRGGGRWADFNPRSPRGERRQTVALFQHHTPYMGVLPLSFYQISLKTADFHSLFCC